MTKLTILTTGFLLAMSTPLAAAEDDLFLVHEDVIIPGAAQKYDDANINLLGLFHKYAIKSFISYTAFDSPGSFKYYFYRPITDVGSQLSDRDARFDELKAKLGEVKFKETMSQFHGTYSSHGEYLIRYMKDLSFTPPGAKTPKSSKPDILGEGEYRTWHSFYFSADKKAEAEALAGEWRKLCERQKVDLPYKVFHGYVGTDRPVLLVTAGASSKADFQAKLAKAVSKLGAGARSLLTRTWAIARKYESHDWHLRKDLSYEAGDNQLAATAPARAPTATAAR